ncbi:nucleotidyl transferase AbiEii/AbiGii toxin family protein [Nitratifractor sp.]|uniref:nucleotidyl transferase AbiEii/AbiGii toxin family protein n=1 Tax=Nitratifractor sp. TaxID=2268144 RepID=UPI0025D8CB5F|nr:nucleotidyl transferase AbiEii/AbiGii toxin family protein [Nitratifractor sp.]
MSYDFSTQKELFHIAYEILQDYGVSDWSFGGGTALSSLYYGHRMSYDIDIFSEDYSGIQTIIAAQKEITQNLGISELEVDASPTGITFYLEGGKLKIDFVYSPALTSSAYNYRNVFGIENIKVQTPQEIIAKKLKFREKATIRDFVDYAVTEEKEKILTKLKSEAIVDMERYFDMIEKFDRLEAEAFNQELKLLLPRRAVCKDDFAHSIHNIMKPGKTIQVALDPSGEVVAFDEFIPAYQEHYAPIGELEIYTIPNTGMDYKELMRLEKAQILRLASNVV